MFVKIHQPKNGVRSWFSLGALALLVGCSAASQTSTMSAMCSKNGTASTKRTNSNSNAVTRSSLTLSLQATDVNSIQPAYGTGFIDITSTNSANAPISKRCTMSIRPLNESENRVRVWTAGHCFFEPQTVEFRNSKYSLSVYLNGGYFSVPFTIDGFQEFANFSKYFDSLLSSPLLPVPQGFKEILSNALPRATTQVCVDEEAKFRSGLGTKAKNIACFSRNEMRGLSGVVTTNSTTAPLLKKVLTALRERENAVLSQLDAETKKSFNAYVVSHSWEQRRVSDLRSISYIINKQFCSATAAERPQPDAAGAPPDSALACPLRSVILGEIAKLLSPADLDMVNSIAEDETTPLVELRRKTMGCNQILLDGRVPEGYDLNQATPCDMGDFSVLTWRRYIDRGPRLTPQNSSDTVFGLNASSYYGFYTNTIPTALNRGSQKAMLFPLNLSTVLDFEYVARLDNGLAKKDLDAFLINYDASKDGINPVKGASGSILSAYGIFPMGLLSTVDGEATSGGASITPLPQVGEEDSVTAPDTSRKNSSGC